MSSSQSGSQSNQPIILGDSNKPLSWQIDKRVESLTKDKDEELWGIVSLVLFSFLLLLLF